MSAYSEFASTITTRHGEIVVRVPLTAQRRDGDGICIEPNRYRIQGLSDLSDEEAFDLAIALLIAAGMDDSAQAANLSHPSRTVNR